MLNNSIPFKMLTSYENISFVAHGMYDDFAKGGTYGSFSDSEREDNDKFY